MTADVTHVSVAELAEMIPPLHRQYFLDAIARAGLAEREVMGLVHGLVSRFPQPPERDAAETLAAGFAATRALSEFRPELEPPVLVPAAHAIARLALALCSVGMSGTDYGPRGRILQ